MRIFVNKFVNTYKNGFNSLNLQAEKRFVGPYTRARWGNAQPFFCAYIVHIHIFVNDFADLSPKNGVLTKVLTKYFRGKGGLL